MRQLEEGVYAAGQIRPQDVPLLAAHGVRMIVNNRPDGEAPGQPPSAEIAQAAAEAGLAYRHIPITQPTPEAVAAMREALAAADGPVLAFCAAGVRSAHLWALARGER